MLNYKSLNLYCSLALLILIFPTCEKQDIDCDDENDKYLFFDDFSNTNLELNWKLAGNPSPIVNTITGNPAPSFDNRGDGNCHSMAVSKQTFDFSKGLTIEVDMLVTGGGCFSHGTFGTSVSDAYGDCEYPKNGGGIQVEYFYNCQSGNMDLYLCFSDKSGESKSFVKKNFPDLKNSWHTYKIVIDLDKYVHYYIDDENFWSSPSPLSLDYNNFHLVLGKRSIGGDAKAFHDNIKIYVD